MRGIPVPKVMWFKDGNRLSSSENRYLIDSKGNGIHILKICDVKDQDHGIYSGTFSNSIIILRLSSATLLLLSAIWSLSNKPLKTEISHRRVGSR